MTTIFSTADGLYTDRMGRRKGTNMPFDAIKFYNGSRFGCVAGVSGELPSDDFISFSRFASVYGHLDTFESTLYSVDAYAYLGYKTDAILRGVGNLASLILGDFAMSNGNPKILCINRTKSFTTATFGIDQTQLKQKYNVYTLQSDLSLHKSIGMGDDYALTALQLGMSPEEIFSVLSKKNYETSSSFNFISKSKLGNEIALDVLADACTTGLCRLDISEDKREDNAIELMFCSTLLFAEWLLACYKYRYSKKRIVKEPTQDKLNKLLNDALARAAVIEKEMNKITNHNAVPYFLFDHLSANWKSVKHIHEAAKNK